MRLSIMMTLEVRIISQNSHLMYQFNRNKQKELMVLAKKLCMKIKDFHFIFIFFWHGSRQLGKD